MRGTLKSNILGIGATAILCGLMATGCMTEGAEFDSWSSGIETSNCRWDEREYTVTIKWMEAPATGCDGYLSSGCEYEVSIWNLDQDSLNTDWDWVGSKYTTLRPGQRKTVNKTFNLPSDALGDDGKIELLIKVMEVDPLYPDLDYYGGSDFTVNGLDEGEETCKTITTISGGKIRLCVEGNCPE